MTDTLKYHQVLGTSPGSGDRALKKAYRKLAMRYHPDVNKSEEAHAKFLEITEAYEILTGQRRSSGWQPKSKEEILAEKLRAAKVRYEKMVAKDRKLDGIYYARVAFGIPWRIFWIGAIYSIFMGTLLCIDYFSTGERRTIPPSDILWNPLSKTISIESADERFHIPEPRFWGNDRTLLRANYSWLFHDLKSVTVLLEPVEGWQASKHSWRMRGLSDFEEYETATFISTASVYSVFPVVHIFFFVPVFCIMLKRPTLRFNLWRLISLWVIYPVIFIISFSNDRIFHLFGW